MRDLCAHVSIIRAEDVAWLSSRLLQLLEGGLALCTPLGGLENSLLASSFTNAVLLALYFLPEVRGLVLAEQRGAAPGPGRAPR